MAAKMKFQWMEKPIAHDYEAAEEQLHLIYDPKKARILTGGLKRAPMAD